MLICEAGFASSLLDAAQQPALLANDALWLKSYAAARRNIHNPNVKSDEIPDDAPHQWAKRIQFYRQTGRWPTMKG